MEFMWTFLGIFLVVTVNSRSAAQSHDSVHTGINKHLLEDIKSLNKYIANHTLEVISDPTLPNNEVDHETDRRQLYIKSKTDETDFIDIDKQVQTTDQSHSVENGNRENIEQQHHRFLKHSFDKVNFPQDQEDKTSNTEENEDTNVHKTYTVKSDIEESKLNVNGRAKSSKKTEISHSLGHDVPSFHDKGSEKVRDKVQKEVKGEGEGITGEGELKKKVKIKILEAENGKPKTYDHEQQYNKLDQTQKTKEGEISKEELKEEKKIKNSHTSEHNIPKPYDKKQLPYKTEQIPKETKVGQEIKEDQKKLKNEMNDVNKETKHGVKDHSQARHKGSYFKNKHTTLSHKITKPTDKHERVSVNSIDNGMTNVQNRHESINSDKPVSHESDTIPMQTTNKKVLKESAFDAHMGNVSKPETSNKGNSANNTKNENVNKVTKLRNPTSRKPYVSKLTSQFLSSLRQGKNHLTTSERKGISTASTSKEKLQSDHMHESTSLNQETHRLQSTTDKEVTEANAKPEKVYKSIRPQQQDVTWHSTILSTNTKNLAGNSLSFSSKNKENIKKPKNATGNRNVHAKDKPNETATHTKQTEIQRTINKSDKTSGNNLAEQSFEDDHSSGDPCKGRNDPSRQYTGSALVAAAVGGVFIGAFAVLLLFHLKQKCKKYVNGDYRRVLMEYDFELNPRFKAH